MVIKYIDCKKYKDIETIKKLLKANGIKDVKEVLDCNRAISNRVFYIFIIDRYVDTFYDSEDAENYWGEEDEANAGLDAAIEWYEEDYSGESYDDYEELILQSNKISIGTL